MRQKKERRWKWVQRDINKLPSHSIYLMPSVLQPLLAATGQMLVCLYTLLLVFSRFRIHFSLFWWNHHHSISEDRMSRKQEYCFCLFVFPFNVYGYVASTKTILACSKHSFSSNEQVNKSQMVIKSKLIPLVTWQANNGDSSCWIKE